MSNEPLCQDVDFDRNFWSAHARRDLQEAFKALEDGRIAFGSWERLYLSAAIDHFRDGNQRRLHGVSLVTAGDSHSLALYPRERPR